MRKTLEVMALLAAGLLFTNKEVKAEELIKNKPKVEININYKTESDQESVDYQISESTIHTRNGIYTDSTRDSNVPELTLDEENQVKNIISDIQNQNINSYQDLITASQNLSENQKLLLSSIHSHLLYMFNSDMKLSHNGLGTCRQITTQSERYLNDLEIKSHSVSGISDNGIGHAYVISKIENGSAIVDSYNILTTNTKNIEKTLQAYQKYNSMTTFQHLFFEDTEFKYRLITKDGKNFLDFIEYDETSEPLKNVLIEDIVPQLI